MSDLKLTIEAILNDADFQKGLKNISKGTEDTAKKSKGFIDTLKTSWLGITAAITGVVLVINEVIGVTKKFIDAAVAQQQAINKLSAYAKNLGLDFNDVLKSAKNLSANGLLPFTDAAQALSNLLAKGFNLKEANDLIKIFTDNAMVARPAHLGLAEAVVKTTEGIKNENSLLTDSSGIQKNYAKILEDGAKALGIQVNQLSNAQKVQILYNGFMKEGAVLSGQAEKQAQDYTGQQAVLNNEMVKFNTVIGNQILPSVKEGQKEFIKIVHAITAWIEKTNAVQVALLGLKTVFDFLIGNIKIIASSVRMLFTPLIEGAIAATKVILTIGDSTLSLKEKFNSIKEIGSTAWKNIGIYAQDSANIIADSYTKIGNDVKATYNAINNTAIESGKIQSQAAIQAKAETDKTIYESDIVNKELLKANADDYTAYLDMNRENELIKEEEKYLSLLNYAVQNNMDTEEIERQHQENIKKINDEVQDAILKKRIETANKYVGSAQDMNNKLTELSGTYLQIEKNNLEDMLKHKDKFNEEDIKRQKKKIHDLAMMNKRLQQVQAVIDGAMGVMSIVANWSWNPPVMAGLIAATAAITAGQVALIEQQQIPALAKGTRNFQGGMALVGEAGPELVQLPKGANVISNADMMSNLGGGIGSNITNDNRRSSSSYNFAGANFNLPNVRDTQSFLDELSKIGNSMGLDMFAR